MIGTGLAALLVLGVVQGLTEFLPVSSSGHLVIGREWLGLASDGSLSREIALHFGTLVAVVIFCWRDLISMLGKGSAGQWRLVVGSTIVTAAIAFPAKDFIEAHLNDLFSAGCGLLVTTALLLLVAPRRDEGLTRTLDQGTFVHALVLGLFQSMALVPGVSRAGSTIVAALVLGYTRAHAVRIAFLISIPAVGGAVVLDAVGGGAADVVTDLTMPAAMVVAAVVGLGALRFMSIRTDAATLRAFGFYTLAMGAAAILTA